MAVDYFLKLDGIQGESVDANHKDWIRINSFSWGASQVTTVAGTGGSGAGKADLADFSVMKHLDKGSTPLFKSLVSGTHIKTGNLEAVKAGAGGKPFLKVDFKELFVTSIQHSATDEIPHESVSFSYNQIKIEYSQQNEQGIVTTTGAVTYNVKENKVS
ncbi:MAG: type VI secretion system tube protein Hcp [Terracidiphilus sp.]|jgi:type VI secretion system secreted protein Hcp